MPIEVVPADPTADYGSLVHLVTALAWERAAFIRARVCAGDLAAGEAFLAAIRPFVWRKSLDFGAIAEIGRLTAQIRSNYKGERDVGPGFDLKRGRGGIRREQLRRRGRGWCRKHERSVPWSDWRYGQRGNGRNRRCRVEWRNR